MAKTTRKLLAAILSLMLIIGMIPLTVVSAASYTACKAKTVSWQMIYDHPGTYYWYKSSEYCQLTAVKSGSSYYVTLHRSSKGDELRYLKQDKDDDSSSKKDWKKASEVYEGGTLYQTDSGSGSGSGSTSDLIADGTYRATSTGYVSKDDEKYYTAVTVVVSGGKITSLTATSTATTSDNKEYFAKALKGIQSSLVGQTATKTSGSNVDAVSKATKSSNIIKEAIDLALENAPTVSGGSTAAYTVTWKNYDGTTLETDKNVTSGTKPSYNSAAPTRAADSQYSYTFSGWSTGMNSTSGTAAAGLPAVIGDVTYYAAFSKTAIPVEEKIADGIYGDHSVQVSRMGYTPIVTVTVKNGSITDISADADTGSTNLEFLEEALDGLKGKLLNQSAASVKNLSSDTDAVSGATLSSKAIIEEMKIALSNEAKGNYTVVWQNDDGTVLKTEKNVPYGTRTEKYSSEPTKAEDDRYTYTFNGWTPDIAVFVTGNTTYTAKYDAAEKGSDEPEVKLIPDGKYADGTEYIAFGYVPYVKIVVKDGIIANVSVTADVPSRSQSFFNAAVGQFKEQIEGKAATESLIDEIDAVSGATASQNSLKNAVKKALTAENTITWNDDNGTILDTEKVSSGSMAQYDGTEPSKTGYEFAGWSPETDVVTGDAVYTAKYDEKIELVPDGKYADGTEYIAYGYIPYVKVVVKDGIIVNVSVTADVPSRSQSFFDAAVEQFKEQLEGKAASEKSIDEIDAVSGATASQKSLKNAVKKAFAANNTVTWSDDDGTVLDTEKVSGGSMAQYDGTEPTKKGYKFTGWSPRTGVITGNKIYTAVYEEIPALVNLSEIQSQQIVLGDTFRITAKAEGGTAPYTYAVYYKQKSQTTWTAAQSTYAPAITNPITPKAATTYIIRVKVKDSAGTIVNKDFTVNVTKALTNTSTISATSIPLGNSLTLTGSATGGTAPYTYAVYYKQKSQTTWTAAQSAYAATITNPVTPKAVTTYTIRVKVKDSAGTIVNKDFTVDVTKGLTNTSTIRAESITLGDSVTLTGAATGGTGTKQYIYYCKLSTASSWTTIQGYSTAASATFTPSKTGTYDICIKVKDESGLIVKKYFTLTVK